MVPWFEKCGKRVKKQGFIHRLFFSALPTRALSGYLIVVFSGPSWLSLFGADSLSRSVHCAPDENDKPSEETKIFKLTSVYMFPSILVSSLELNNSVT